MSYRLLPQAERDLEAIADFVAARNPRAAMQLVEHFHERWANLAAFPMIGSARPDLNAEARHLVVGNYLSLYRVRDGNVEIVRILHGRMDVKPDDFG
jgi:toxin ParE1/3/4